MSDYPLPAYAAHIWIAGDEVYLVLPSPLDAPSHTVKFPATERGLSLALRILRDREKHGSTTIGQKGAPTQYEVEEIYRTLSYNEKLAKVTAKKAVTEAEKAEAIAFLEELDL